MGGERVLVPPRNPPTKQPPRIGQTKNEGPVKNKNCARRTLVLNDRGRCVRALHWLLTAEKPAIRPARKAKGANHNRRYWHLRNASAHNGVYGKATVLAVQKAKWRLGYPSGQANGAAGPKLRAYLLGSRRLPKAYVGSQPKRYQAWKAQQHKSADVKGLLRDAAYLLEANWRVHYTQTMTGPHGRLSLLTHYPRGPPIGGELYGDCSGTVEALYIWNGFPDPAGPGAYRHYPSVAVYTGTQVQHGTRVWRAGESLSRIPVGALVFYGGPGGGSHVAMYIGNGRVFSHGSEGCPCNNSVLYRDDAYEARRYSR
jgi:hypothetical protein